jgi:hypothetical protein
MAVRDILFLTLHSLNAQSPQPRSIIETALADRTILTGPLHLLKKPAHTAQPGIIAGTSESRLGRSGLKGGISTQPAQAGQTIQLSQTYA